MAISRGAFLKGASLTSLAGILAACSTGNSNSSSTSGSGSSASAEAGAFPVTISTQYGDVKLEKAPEKIAVVNAWNHSEAIITNNYANAQRFLNEIDAAAVYVNASTRFTDGEEFGFGAEIGISTQKLHARGPMGLKELTTTKYIIYGDGQIR